MKIVSACLAGLECRYDCKSQSRDDIRAMVARGDAIPVCPEQMGGLPTPRNPAERIQDKVLSNTGIDLTQHYLLGAREALKITQLCGADEVLLKSKSPMCGYGLIYDGTFSGNLIPGNGIFAELLLKNGIKVRSVD
jgi:uncharacterized protein YbbK (DUF523 family)